LSPIEHAVEFGAKGCLIWKLGICRLLIEEDRIVRAWLTAKFFDEPLFLLL
jgi:hypothetical protein